MPAKSSVGGTAVQLAASGAVKYGVQVTAAPANTGTVYVGFADTVTANSADATDGVPLPAGASVFLPVVLLANKAASDVWLIASAAGQKVFYGIDQQMPVGTAGGVGVALGAGTANIGDVDIETFEPSADVTMQSAAVATGNGTVLTVTGYGTATVQITGTFVATTTFEGTTDGTNYVSISATQIGAASIATTATTAGIYRLGVSGLTHIRARISAYTSGSVTSIGRATNAPFGPKVIAISGTVTVGSHAVTNAGTFATQPTIQAGTALIGKVSNADRTDKLFDGTTELTPKFAAIAAATSGANTLVAAVASKKIRVTSLCLVAGAAGNVYFTSAAAGAVIFGGSTNKINLAANGGFILPFSATGWFETVAGELLNLNASSTGPFSGGLTYLEV